MIFVDANVFMYAVGHPHPLKGPARQFFDEARINADSLCTSAEVLQELSHAYMATNRLQTLDAAHALVRRTRVEVWPLEEEDVALARQLHEQHPTLSARDLCYLASCQRRGIREIMTFDRDLAAAASRGR